MGRIDEALRRAAESGQNDATQPAARPSSDAFESPWSFEGDERPSLPPRQPEPRPRDITAEPDTYIHAPEPPRRDPGADMLPREPLALFPGFDKDMAQKLVIGPSAPAHLAEPFRRLAATLHHAQLVNGIKSLLVTSALAGDGKSFTAVNLALTLSESYRRNVLLIDADLRRPSLHEIFRVPNVVGLNEGLAAGEDAQLAALKLTQTLTLLPAGKPVPDPMGGLSSERMRRILTEASARFEWVIVDTPPVGLLADANLLGSLVDGALLVVRANQTPYPAVTRALEAIGRDRVLGVVLNGAQAMPDSDYARYYKAPDVVPAAPGAPGPGTPALGALEPRR